MVLNTAGSSIGGGGSSAIPPLMPTVDAILVLDGDGNRLAGKYYNNEFLGKAGGSGGGTTNVVAGQGTEGLKSVEELRLQFEKQLHQKIAGIVARPDGAEVVTCHGRTAVFCGGGADVRIVHVGPPGESELVLAHLCEGMYEALSHLMGGSTDRTMVLDNLELVFLLIDEHCDGGLILEVDGNKLAGAVLLRDEEGVGNPNGEAAGAPGGVSSQGMPAGVNTADLTIGQAFRQAREQFLANMAGRDGT